MKLITISLILLHGTVSFTTAQLFTGSSVPGGRSFGSGANVQCKVIKDSSGRYRSNCAGANPNEITIGSEHILWIPGGTGTNYLIDIEVPNYKIQELIKAGFKPTNVPGPQVNVLLKRPEQTYDAQVDKDTSSGGPPQVNLQYETPQKLLVHYPNDKQFSPLSGPLLPPARNFGPPPVQGQQRFEIDPRLGNNFGRIK